MRSLRDARAKGAKAAFSRLGGRIPVGSSLITAHRCVEWVTEGETFTISLGKVGDTERKVAKKRIRV